jgi:hypothetical protein
MKSLPVSLLGLEIGVRWTARVLSALLLGLVLVPMVVNCIYDVVHGFYEDGVPHSLKLVGVEPIQTPFFWTACIGMVVAWRWSVIGGALSLGGMILLFAVAFAMSGELPGGLLVYLMLLPGILFMVDGLIRRRMLLPTILLPKH